MKKITAYLTRAFSLCLLVFALSNCAPTSRLHPTQFITVTPEQTDAHTAIQKYAGGQVEVRILPDSAATDQAFTDWLTDAIFILPADTTTTKFRSNNEMSGGGSVSQTIISYTHASVPGGFRLFPVEYLKPQPVTTPVLYAGMGGATSTDSVVVDFIVASVTYQPGDLIFASLGPVCNTKTRDAAYPVPGMLYSLQQLRTYVPPAKRDVETPSIENRSFDPKY